MRILVTGVAGFIGFNFSEFLLKKNYKIIGVDNINDYYSQKLKKDRLKNLKRYQKFSFYKFDLNNSKHFKKLSNKKFDAVFHFAAQAGVRYSVEHPRKYIDSNIQGFFNILEFVREKKIGKFFYASSSSVYGNSKLFPLKEKNLLYPNNTYSITKKFNEDLATVYKNFYKINLAGLRFYSICQGRPDMFYYKVIDSAFKKKSLYLNNFSNHSRDFTYIRDVNIILFNLLRKKTKFKMKFLIFVQINHFKYLKL